ncbi:ATP-binding protein [Subsaximicrobium wynnwilliamsii]|uniref:ATP-binding protein n=1 Tax=Subsaximicrobium wynnwilliamsii TaxID=291179 RepID=A0A5C6ZD73_9FLAO|nr:ATP-binding protein [Subsaximicrobium wynnwilliamsii]TXD80858.1 ATP-binding protein [Subsaximicrobium wynnwilliamsii]TXD86517.1 ATP-binding protein [Subsaximicrobium wynnwilliamsii]TXE00144.1 ATP-binding protein [Subsaximicrobium wynnwilliamsii]
MLLEFKIKNFRSIKDWQSFSMLGESKVKELENSLIDHNGYKVLSSAIIYGRNASGKSNLLKAFKMIQYMVIFSDDFKVDDKIDYYEPYKLDKNFRNEPVEFLIDFIGKDGIRYEYGLGYSSEEIVYENLRFYPKSQPAWLFRREKGEKIKYGESLTGNKKNIEELLYKNQLFLSKIGTEKNKQLAIPYSFFSKYLYVSDVHDTSYDNVLIQLFTNKMGKDNIPFFKENINKLMCVADTGIQSINIEESEINLDGLPKEMTDEDKNELRERYKYKIRTLHREFENGKEIGNIEFHLGDESTGTLKLLAVGGLILEALADGQTLVIDELDKSLHPKLTRMLIRIFRSPKLNPKNAQLIFATHDVSLLDNELFRRDQVWFAEKEFEGNSHYYSISDIPGVRGNVPYEKWYMTGRFGATPVINEHELDFHY